MQGVKGEAVVVYADPLTTPQMRYHRLSRRVNNMTVFPGFLDITHSGLQDMAQYKLQAMAAIAFEILLSCCLCNTGGNLRG
jgi:hypothetical protein